MYTIKQLNSQIEDTKSLQLVTQALGEIATIKLKSTRELVEHTTKFFDEITGVYHALKLIAAKRQFLNSASLNQKNGKTVGVLITSNYHFYGGLDNKLIAKFIQDSISLKMDKIVIGKFGKDYLTGINYLEKYQSLVFKTDFPSQVEVKLLVDKTINYSKVLVYNSRFVTVMKQTEQVFDISQSMAEVEARTSRIDFILEPELDKMLNFFESQILTSLYQAIFLQAQLAKTAARMISMFNAESNAGNVIKKQKSQLSQARRSLQNIRILETYAGVKKALSKDSN